MPHARRYICANNVYSVMLRVREGLPFVPLMFMKHILLGCMARAQCVDRAIINHFLWMTNHLHLIVVAKDAYELTQLYGELQKKITDSMKKILNIDRLNLWEGAPVVARLADLEATLNHIVYIYANPARANLERTIERYPGLSSWELFQNIENTLSFEVERDVKWYRVKDLPVLPCPVISERTDSFLCKSLDDVGIPETLYVQPNAWIGCFGVTDEEEIKSINESIRSRLTATEAELEQKRKIEGKTVIGQNALKLQALNKAHKPKVTEGERKVYVIASDKNTRIEYIRQFKELCQLCTECFQSWLKGILVPWPPGFFRPPLRHMASALEA